MDGITAFFKNFHLNLACMPLIATKMDIEHADFNRTKNFIFLHKNAPKLLAEPDSTSPHSDP